MELYLTRKQCKTIDAALANVQTHFEGCDTKVYKWQTEALFRLRRELISAVARADESYAKNAVHRKEAEA